MGQNEHLTQQFPPVYKFQAFLNSFTGFSSHNFTILVHSLQLTSINSSHFQQKKRFPKQQTLDKDSK